MNKWVDIWGIHKCVKTVMEIFEHIECPALPPMAVGDLDTITHMYPGHTGVGGDGLHPKVGNQLSVAAKKAIVDGLNQSEKLEAWLGVLNILNAAPKETGGYRLLGLFSTRYRWWSRMRFLHAAEWEKGV